MSEELNATVVALLQEAAEWRLLSVLFEYPGRGWSERLSAIAADVHGPRLKQAAEAALNEASAGMHHSIFGPGGPVSPREASYTNGIQLGYLLAEISAYYSAFAYTPPQDEPVDHVSVETGLIAYLRLKQAYATACGEENKAAITADAAAEFLREHIARIASPIAAGLAPIAPAYLVTSGALLLERAGPRRTELGTFGADIADDEDATCGTLC